MLYSHRMWGRRLMNQLMIPWFFFQRSKYMWKKREKGRSKSHGRPLSLGNSKEKYWNYIKFGYFKRDCKEEKNKNTWWKIMILMMVLRNLLKRRWIFLCYNFGNPCRLKCVVDRLYSFLPYDFPLGLVFNV